MQNENNFSEGKDEDLCGMCVGANCPRCGIGASVKFILEKYQISKYFLQKNQCDFFEI